MEECPICFEEIALDTLEKCHHKFCKVCLSKLPKHELHVSCPICRMDNLLTTEYCVVEISSDKTKELNVRSFLCHITLMIGLVLFSLIVIIIILNRVY